MPTFRRHVPGVAVILVLLSARVLAQQAAETRPAQAGPATAFSGTPYFTASPGDKCRAWDASVTFDYMPRQFSTFRFEYNNASNVPYFSGLGGVTPPGGNIGPPGSVVPGFTPDLRKYERRFTIALLVKF